MSKDHDKLMAEIQRLIAGQEFNSEEELQTYLKGILGQKIPSSPNTLLSVQEQAQDLVFAAYELPLNKAKLKTLASLALLDAIPFDFDGYELLDADYKLSYVENDLQLAISKAAIEVHDLQLLEKKQKKMNVNLDRFLIKLFKYPFPCQQELMIWEIYYLKN